MKQTEQIKRRSADTRSVPPMVIGADPRTDLGVIKIGAKGLPMLSWGDSSQLQVAALALALKGGLSMARKSTASFNPKTFLANVNGGSRTLQVNKNHQIFSQGDAADAVFYIQRGKVKLTVLSPQGKEAVVAILELGDFLGETCLVARKPVRSETATALDDATLMRIEKTDMTRMLQDEPVFSARFMTYLLARNVRIQADLVDHLFNSAEKRLARVLLLLAHFGEEGAPEPVIPKISQEMLAEMIGTTRSRVSFFLNKFKKQGYIHSNRGLHIHSALLNIVLHG